MVSYIGTLYHVIVTSIGRYLPYSLVYLAFSPKPSPLHWAAANCNAEAVRLLLDRGVDKEAKNFVRGERDTGIGDVLRK